MKKFRDNKKVSILTVPELRQIIRELVGELIFELEQNLPDPDEGLEFKPEFEAALTELEEAKQQGKITYISHDKVKQRLGLVTNLPPHPPTW